jgi:hypothetical protein
MNNDDIYLLALQEDLINARLEIEKLKSTIKEQANKIRKLEDSLMDEIKQGQSPSSPKIKTKIKTKLASLLMYSFNKK